MRCKSFVCFNYYIIQFCLTFLNFVCHLLFCFEVYLGIMFYEFNRNNSTSQLIWCVLSERISHDMNFCTDFFILDSSRQLACQFLTYSFLIEK